MTINVMGHWHSGKHHPRMQRPSIINHTKLKSNRKLNSTSTPLRNFDIAAEERRRNKDFYASLPFPRLVIVLKRWANQNLTPWFTPPTTSGTMDRPMHRKIRKRYAHAVSSRFALVVHRRADADALLSRGALGLLQRALLLQYATEGIWNLGDLLLIPAGGIKFLLEELAHECHLSPSLCFCPSPSFFVLLFNCIYPHRSRSNIWCPFVSLSLIS